MTEQLTLTLTNFKILILRWWERTVAKIGSFFKILFFLIVLMKYPINHC